MAITKVTGALLGNLSVGTGNVALGDSALDDGSLSGDNNVAIGSAALTANTTGERNTQSLEANTIGDRSIAIGYQALTSQNPSSNADMYNVAIGHAAGSGSNHRR
jgi:hypothetical protein